jgi:hypothetical protein
MSKGKAGFLRSLKEVVAQRKKREVEERFVLDYLKRWSRGLGENPDEENLRWLKRFLDLLSSRHQAEQANCDQEIDKLFAECELNRSEPADKELLLIALAQTIYPRPAGAKHKWDAKYYDELWHDIILVKEDYYNAEAARTEGSDRKLSSASIADKLVKSKKFSTKYRSKKQGFEKKIGADSLRKRVSDAMDAGLDHNPNLLIFDFDYILRGDPEKGPACAAGLSFQPALPRGSAAAKEAASLEKELFAEAQSLFESLGLFMTDQSKCDCRRAARILARRTVRQRLEGR